MSLFKKPTRKFRQRTTHHDSDDELNPEKTRKNDSSPNRKEDHKLCLSLGSLKVEKSESIPGLDMLDNPPKKTIKEEVITKTKPSKLLSFDEEEEEEVFKVKKSNYSRRLAKQREKEKTESKVKPIESNEEEPPSDLLSSPTLIVKPLELPIKSKNYEIHEKCSVLNGEEAEDLADSDEDDKQHLFNPFKDALQSGVIPDAKTIFAVKKHRQMAREMGDYIPIDDSEKYQEDKSRLIRDDDNDRSDDDDSSGRINFAINVASIERQKTREAFLSTLDEENDEMDNWEREQIRKGVGLAPLPADKGLISPSSLPSYETVKHSIERKASLNPPLIKNKVALTTESIKERLRAHLQGLQETQSSHQREYESYKDELVATYDNIDRLKREGPELSKRFSFYQEMRAYVEDLSECMDIKLPKVELLERKTIDLYKSRSVKLIARRRQDVKDQSEEFSVLANKAMRGLPIDFLEDKPPYEESKARRAAEREGRRMRRRKQREKDSRIVHNEGISSDDEENDNEVVLLEKEVTETLEEAKNIFNDVVEEFCSLEGVKNSFLRWRDQENTSYKDAYVYLCLPKVFSAFVRLELLNWNPTESGRPLEMMNWHRTLLNYGWDHQTEAWTCLKEDQDSNLIPSIVDKIILPRINEWIEHVWDPLSTSQTLNLVKIITRLTQDNPTIDGNSPRLQNLLRLTVNRFQKSLEEDIFVPLYPRTLLDTRTSVALFFNRQFWTCVKLLHNILTWHGLLAESPLQELSLGCLLNRYMILALQSFPPNKSVVEKAKAILNTFPRAWFSNKTQVQQLEMFQRFLNQLAGRIKALEDVESLNWCVREIAGMLNTLGAQEKGLALCREYGLKD